MKLQLLRNATLKLTLGERTILIDPFFAPKHSRPSIAGRSPNPLVDLPVSTDQVLEGVELVIVSHLHSDHFDPVAQGLVPKDLPIVCQPGDDTKIRSFGFEKVTPLHDNFVWRGVKLTRRKGRHGFGPVVEKMGPVMGFSVELEGEPSLYWAGDTVLYPPVEETIRSTDPDIIVIHPSGALWEGQSIAMDAEQAVTLGRIFSRPTIVATHLEALDHTTVSRDDLRHKLLAQNIAAERFLIPHDGEVLTLGVPA
ncbi:MBL fold metallo-hydrolase [Bradyrhizobium brasilense]|uniref:MBL fold metallo-hydrolase n=1 Tax=Bradyrhizobium brasilense TaxID=1419277 RepID=UPI001456EFC3|nr:MBL fold metallo-hydrolase [Bradyrhizobium brasilense]NLS68237.1 MBL fold metallo-hydrolase [Bradyrhizobium brasilense]